MDINNYIGFKIVINNFNMESKVLLSSKIEKKIINNVKKTIDNEGKTITYYIINLIDF